MRSHDGNGKEFLEFATALNVSAGGMLVAIRRVLPLLGQIKAGQIKAGQVKAGQMKAGQIRTRQIKAAQISLEIPSAPVAAVAVLPHASRNLRARALRTTPAEGYYLLGLKFARPLLESDSPNGSRSANGSRRRKLDAVS